MSEETNEIQEAKKPWIELLKPRGDRAIWLCLILLTGMSFVTVYSASTNIVLNYGKQTTTVFMLKHSFLIALGMIILLIASNVPYRYYAPFSVLMLPFSFVLLILTLMKGTTIGDANASRWLEIPYVNIQVQTSLLSSLILMVYLARSLSKKLPSEWTFKTYFFQLLLPIGATCGLILPANLSTAAILFFLSFILLFIAHVPWKFLLSTLGSGVVFLGLFILLVMLFPNISNRVDTWKARIENYQSGNVEDNYQVEKAKMAIANGGLMGMGPGKSIQKNFLPQSTSDFIYAIVIEEYGILGGLSVLAVYFFLLMRFLIVATKAKSLFGSLLVLAAGLGIVFQAFINMGVAVNLLPVTGQTLPMLSQGGSSIWISCTALGIILSVSRSYLEPTSTQSSKNPENNIDEQLIPN